MLIIDGIEFYGWDSKVVVRCRESPFVTKGESRPALPLLLTKQNAIQLIRELAAKEPEIRAAAEDERRQQIAIIDTRIAALAQKREQTL